MAGPPWPFKVDGPLHQIREERNDTKRWNLGASPADRDRRHSPRAGGHWAQDVVGAGGRHPPGHRPVGMVTRLVGVGVLNAQRVVMLRKALGLAIPQPLLIRADEVIQG